MRLDHRVGLQGSLQSMEGHIIPFLHTSLYNFDPLKPQFYIVKLGFTGVNIIFLISAQKHRLWVLVSPASSSDSNEYHNLYFEQKYKKCQNYLSESLHVFYIVRCSVTVDYYSTGLT